MKYLSRKTLYRTAVQLMVSKMMEELKTPGSDVGVMEFPGYECTCFQAQLERRKDRMLQRQLYLTLWCRHIPTDVLKKRVDAKKYAK